jgi:hypothetical protein
MEFSKEPESFVIGLMTHATPSEVYAWLKDRYTKCNDGRANWYEAAYESVEQALLNRGEPLVTLGLARYGRSREVIQKIWERVGNDASNYLNKAVRIACISNESVDCSFLHDVWAAWMPEADAERLLLGKSVDEKVAFLQCPVFSDAFCMLLKRSGVFARISEDDWIAFLNHGTRNPLLQRHDDGDDYPDMEAYDREKAFASLVDTLPQNSRAVYALVALFEKARAVHSVPSLSSSLARWEEINFSAEDRESLTGERGYPFIDNLTYLRCLIAARAGGTAGEKSRDELRDDLSSSDESTAAIAFAKYQFKSAGEFDDCYTQNRTVYGRDVGAMNNSSVMLNPESREVLRTRLIDDPLERAYLFADERHRRLSAANAKNTKESASERSLRTAQNSLNALHLQLAKFQAQTIAWLSWGAIASIGLAVLIWRK